VSGIDIIQSGESYDFITELNDEGSVSGWVCTIYLKKVPSDSSTAYLTPRVITASGNTWPGFLTQAETAALGTGLYYLIFNKVNSSTDEEETTMQRVRVTQNWV